MHSAPASYVISPAHTINFPVVSSISSVHYRYLCYLIRYLGLFLFLFIYKDIHYTSYSYTSVHTRISIYYPVLYIVWHALALLFTDFSALLPATVSYPLYAVQPLSHVFSNWHLTLSWKNSDAALLTCTLLSPISSRSPAAYSAVSTLSHQYWCSHLH